MTIRGSGWLGALAGCAIMLGTTSVYAQSGTPSFYVTGGAGVSFPRDSSVEGPGFDLDAELDRGWMALIGIGHAYGNGFRTEFEIARHNNDVDNVGGAAAGGDVTAWSFMANVLYDIPTNWPVRPFVGIGAGAARVKADGFSPVAGSVIDDSDTAFAWQATAGVAYAITSQLEATAAYRYFSVPSLDFNTNAGTGIDSDYATHNIMVGLRYHFGTPPRRMAEPAQQPAPPPPPRPEPAPPQAAPAPQPAPPPAPRNYLVFFDWNSAAITAQARGILETAATNAKRSSPVRIRATGHADRSGPDGYNMRLSMRRANAVKAELVRLGVPESEIAVVARGEREPLVQTADGVREPQNRRVEIVLE